MNFFKYEEFDSPDLPNSGRTNMDADFLRMLDDARKIADIPFKISSGYRTEEHNQKVGGVKGSSHLKGKAADITTKDSRERWIILSALQKAGFNRIGLANSFLHVDNDPDKSPNVIWTY
tara:strand:+ start:667 stop:1023 length:357 start_codon:yes stop_codon:yes gene_type:complete